MLKYKFQNKLLFTYTEWMKQCVFFRNFLLVCRSLCHWNPLHGIFRSRNSRQIDRRNSDFLWRKTTFGDDDDAAKQFERQSTRNAAQTSQHLTKPMSSQMCVTIISVIFCQMFADTIKCVTIKNVLCYLSSLIW